MVNYVTMPNVYGSVRKKHNLCGLLLRKKYRSHFEITALVLEAVKNDGAARFSIMKHASINCTQLKTYLRSLIEIGFIEMDIKRGRVLYKASEKGLDFLRQYYVLLEMLLSAHGQNKSTSVFNRTGYYETERQQQPTAQIVTHLQHPH